MSLLLAQIKAVSAHQLMCANYSYHTICKSLTHLSILSPYKSWFLQSKGCEHSCHQSVRRPEVSPEYILRAFWLASQTDSCWHDNLTTSNQILPPSLTLT